jgi:Ser/Thr protein kinase RdoA (MazF antagonist)
MSKLDCAYATPSAHSIARFVTDRFPFGSVGACRLLQRGFNDLYVAEAVGRRAVLRLSRAGRRRASDLEYEALLLAHLRSRGVPVVAPRCGHDGRYCQAANAPEGTRFALLFDFVAGREPHETPADAYAQGAVLARIHAETTEFAIHQDRFNLDLDHLLDRPLTALGALLGDRPEVYRYLADLADRLRRLIAIRGGALSWGVCHGDCHGFNARFGPEGAATLLDFDDGGPGWRAYDLAVFLWSARAFGPARRALWQPFLDGYRTQRPIAHPELDAVRVFIPIRHIWLMGEYAIGSTGWGTQWLAAWFDRQIEFLRNWEAEQLDCPLRLDTSPVPSSFGLAV